MTAFIAPADDDEPTASTATTPFLDTTDAERVEYLYSIPDEAEPLDEDFADDWATATTKAAAARDDSYKCCARGRARAEPARRAAGRRC